MTTEQHGIADISQTLYDRVTKYHAQIGHNVKRDALQELEWKLLSDSKWVHTEASSRLQTTLVTKGSLRVNGAYQFRVRACNTLGDCSLSPWSAGVRRMGAPPSGGSVALLESGIDSVQASEGYVGAPGGDLSALTGEWSGFEPSDAATAVGGARSQLATRYADAHSGAALHAAQRNLGRSLGSLQLFDALHTSKPVAHLRNRCHHHVS